MVRWGVMVAGLLVLGSIPVLVGLAVVLPWLGYSTWHLSDIAATLGCSTNAQEQKNDANGDHGETGKVGLEAEAAPAPTGLKRVTRRMRDRLLSLAKPSAPECRGCRQYNSADNEQRANCDEQHVRLPISRHSFQRWVGSMTLTGYLRDATLTLFSPTLSASPCYSLTT